MTEQLENTMIRELSDDELRVVAGAKPMEAEAGRYVAPMPKVCTYEVANRCYVWGYGGIGAIAQYYAERGLEMLRHYPIPDGLEAASRPLSYGCRLRWKGVRRSSASI